MLTVEALEKELNSGKLKGIYLLYGEDTFLLEQQLHKIKKNFGEVVKGINYISIDENNIQELIADIETPAFGYVNKLIIARNTGIFKREAKGRTGGVSKELKDKINDYLKENIDMINDAVVLVFVENETEKIKKNESVIFDLTDNLGQKKVKEAMDVLYNLIASKEPIQKILITLYNHFKKLYFVKLAIAYNKDIAQSLQLKPNQMFLVNKYKAQAKGFKTSELRKIVQELENLDYKYKIGLIDLNVGLEAILCAYCS